MKTLSLPPVLRMFHKWILRPSPCSFCSPTHTCAKTFDFSLPLVEITHGNTFIVSAKACLGSDGSSRSCGCRLISLQKSFSVLEGGLENVFLAKACSSPFSLSWAPAISFKDDSLVSPASNHKIGSRRFASQETQSLFCSSRGEAVAHTKYTNRRTHTRQLLTPFGTEKPRGLFR